MAEIEEDDISFDTLAIVPLEGVRILLMRIDFATLKMAARTAPEVILEKFCSASSADEAIALRDSIINDLPAGREAVSKAQERIAVELRSLLASGKIALSQ